MRAIRDREVHSALHIDDAHAKALAADVRHVRDALAVGRPRDVAVRHPCLVGDVPLVLARAINDPDGPTLITARVAKEGELRTVG